jgi:hypothetical protein
MMRVRQSPSFKYQPQQSVGNQARRQVKHTSGSSEVEPGKGEIFSGSPADPINLTHSESRAYRQQTNENQSNEYAKSAARRRIDVE